MADLVLPCSQTGSLLCATRCRSSCECEWLPFRSCVCPFEVMQCCWPLLRLALCRCGIAASARARSAWAFLSARAATSPAMAARFASRPPSHHVFCACCQGTLPTFSVDCLYWPLQHDAIYSPSAFSLAHMPRDQRLGPLSSQRAASGPAVGMVGPLGLVTLDLKVGAGRFCKSRTAHSFL